MNLLTSLLTAVIGTVLFWFSGVIDRGTETSPPAAVMAVIGCVFIVAGLIGFKRSDDAYAKRVGDSAETTLPEESLRNGLLRSLKELFVGRER